ncbi:MAG: hypothetical protein COB71_03575 [Thiotrichales bacterium]|nr:MAG: hypothetical protein COB71_03575 [Thiotrichales bacterium]
MADTCARYSLMMEMIFQQDYTIIFRKIHLGTPLIQNIQIKRKFPISVYSYLFFQLKFFNSAD